MATTDVTALCASLTLADVDDDEVTIQLPLSPTSHDAEEEVYYAVGRLVTDKPIRLAFFHDTMAAVWRPVMRVNVKELSLRKCLFRFYDDRYISRIIAEGPYSYEQSLLILRRVPPGSDPESIPLTHTEFWVQVHLLPRGFQSEAVVSAIASSLGTFIKTDERNFDGSMRTFYRVRVALDVAKALKKQMKLKKDNCGWAVIDFKYKRMPTFCFFCGVLGHGDRLCHKYSIV
ncbi:PREDICTED: uncharacterized protein LOC109155722 [Ipomoea nil]|uniref:uncharacterized protein LOC109155722 n=1 Tax=Ipomoea nil TaxID=35883 RepID=UPI0009009F54|nr:PREDICTED: uncharacterized protein LOC109155722 [Ipomoea nil]